LTALWVADVLERAGAPAGVVNVVTTSQAGPVSDAILSDPRVATLSFTGSTYVGKLLLGQTAQRVLPSSMELGGNAPFLVLEGADVDHAVEGAMVAKMRNGGSACTAANRFYVHASVAEEFATKFEAALRGLKIGPGIDQSNDLGAMVSIKERDKILELVEAAEAEGTPATVAGEAPGDGAFIAPRIIRGVEHGSTLTRNEIFGPVAPIVTFEDQAEGIRMANDTEYGLISYVFAKDAGEGIKVARQMESGMVAINRGIASDPAASFGGMKESGLGREGGFDGMHEFLETQYFAVDL
jgi:succinate-semialdehyde dehydrogenase/glutarate-semialdehyde dehydrogenase